MHVPTVNPHNLILLKTAEQVSSTICALLIQPKEKRSTVWKKRYLWICALFHLFREETNAGLQGIGICFDLKDSLYTNPGIFSPGCSSIISIFAWCL